MSDIILNSSQKAAVEHDIGPLLIIAGAGTGKTRVITERIANLIDTDKAETNEILALTFTQKAAQEMEERVDIALPYGYTDIAISTFHAFCDQVLRQEAIHLGLDPDYVLMSRAQEYLYFRSHLFDFSLDKLRPKGNPTKFIGEILKHFSRLGDENVSPAEYKEFLDLLKKPLGKSGVDVKNGKEESNNGNSDIDEDLRDNYQELFAVYKEYTDLKNKDSRLSFSDLVPLVIKLFKGNRAILNKYREQYKYVLVDEFQDTNYAQNELIKVLVPPKGNITVVGDDDQAIYKFRGAAISNILDFKNNYPSCKKIVLTKNYRSCQEILDAAYSLIQENNPDRLEVSEDIDKRLERVYPTNNTRRGDDQMGIDFDLSKGKNSKPENKNINDNIETDCPEKCVKRIHTEKDTQESESVVSEIVRLVEEDGYNYSDMAVLVRANNHADEFVNSFKYHGVPFIFPGPKGLYNRPEIKDLIALLRIVVDYQDDASLYRILTFSSQDHYLKASIDNASKDSKGASKTPGGITAREFIDIQRLAKKKHLSVFELLEEITDKRIGNKEIIGGQANDMRDSDSDVTFLNTSPNGLNSNSLTVDRLSDTAGSDTAETDREFDEMKQQNTDKASQRKLYDRLFTKSSKLWIEKLLSAYDRAFNMAQKGQSAGEVLYELLDYLGYLDVLANKQTIRDEWRVQNIGKFFNHLKSFERDAENGSVREFMEYLDYALEIGESPTVDPVDMVDFDAVNISTVHGSKGLEFPVVFLVNLVSGRFPTRNRSDRLPIPKQLIKETLPEGDEHIQEERRLFYVGMTRAEKLLYLTSADYYGDGIRKKKQSLFLHDLDLVKKESDNTGDRKFKLEDLENVVMPEEDEALPENFRDSKLENIIKNLSYSHISTYKTCPYQFYFKYFLGIPGVDSQAKSFGMTMHNTLRAFYERLKIAKEGLPGVEQPPGKEDLVEIYKSKWINKGYESKKQEQNRFKAGKKSLLEYFDDFYTWEANPVWLEEKFRVNVDDFWIKGVVDRLDKEDDGLVIVDYKTGKIPSRRPKKDLQLALYAMAVEEIRKEKVREAYLMYLQGPKKFTVDIGDEVRREVKEEIKEVLEELKKMDFKPTPGFLCRYCDYRSICDYAEYA
jgi:CRISPR-associated protein Cas4